MTQTRNQQQQQTDCDCNTGPKDLNEGVYCFSCNIYKHLRCIKVGKEPYSRVEKINDKSVGMFTYICNCCVIHKANLTKTQDKMVLISKEATDHNFEGFNLDESQVEVEEGLKNLPDTQPMNTAAQNAQREADQNEESREINETMPDIDISNTANTNERENVERVTSEIPVLINQIRRENDTSEQGTNVTETPKKGIKHINNKKILCRKYEKGI